MKIKQKRVVTFTQLMDYVEKNDIREGVFKSAGEFYSDIQIDGRRLMVEERDFFHLTNTYYIEGEVEVTKHTMFPTLIRYKESESNGNIIADTFYSASVEGILDYCRENTVAIHLVDEAGTPFVLWNREEGHTTI